MSFFRWSLVGLGIYYAGADVDQVSMQELMYPKKESGPGLLCVLLAQSRLPQCYCSYLALLLFCCVKPGMFHVKLLHLLTTQCVWVVTSFLSYQERAWK